MPSAPTTTARPPLATGAGPSTPGRWAGPLAARAEGLRKVYGAGATRVTALDGVDVAFARGELTAIMGPSGSGKSTLMHCVAGLDTADAGTVWVGDTELTALGDRALTELRRDQIGFIFQSFNLLPTLSAAENITLPADIAGRTIDPGWLDQVIDTVGLGDRLGHRPTELSGGQQQRVACARALAGRPELIFADEPTGNLDSRAAAEVLGFLRRTVHDLGQSIVLVTHDPAAAAYADRVLFLADGCLVDELSGPTADTVLDAMKRLEGLSPAAAETRARTSEPAGARRAPTWDPGWAWADGATPRPSHELPRPDERAVGGAGPGGGLAGAVWTAQTLRDQLDRLVDQLSELASSDAGAHPAHDTGQDNDSHDTTPDLGCPAGEPAPTHTGHHDGQAGCDGRSAALADERTRRRAAEAAGARAASQLEGLRVELAETRAAATAALELAADRAEAQFGDARAAHERWQAELDAAHRDRELSAAQHLGANPLGRG